MSEVYILWREPGNGEKLLYGVFLTHEMAFRRMCEQKNRPGNTSEWKVTRREIGVLGEEE